MRAGYTYTTMAAQPGEPTHVTVSFYLDEHAWITVFGVDDGQPRLSIAHGDVSVRVGPADPDAVTEQDARIARSLADQAVSYAAEVERLWAGNDAGGPGTAAA